MFLANFWYETPVIFKLLKPLSFSLEKTHVKHFILESNKQKLD